MTTGHAPDDWLDIPPPPFGPDGDVDGGDGSGDGPGDDEMPTGEIQVVDVPDAENAGEAPTGELPAVDEPAPEAEDAPVGVTMTGQFRAVAAALAADITANRAPDQPEATDEPAPPSDVEQEPIRLTMTGQFRAVAAELAADIAAGNGSRARDGATEGGSDGPATPVDVASGDGAPQGDPARRGATEAGREATTEALSDGRATSEMEAVGGAEVGGGPEARADESQAVGGADAGHGGRSDTKDGSGGASGDAAAGPVGEVSGAKGEGAGPGGEDEAGVEAEAAAGGGGEPDVDVDGMVEVLEAPPGPKAWRVPVLRSKRDPERPPPPDALPAPSEATMEVDGSAEVLPAVGGGGELGPRARRRIEAHRYRTLRLRRQRRLAVAGLALLVTTGATLGIVGMGKVRGSTGGHYVDPQIRPDQPGYVALVSPTPTLLVINKDAAGALSGVSLLSLHAQDQGGSVIVMPVTTVAPFADAGTTFADAYAENGSQGVATQVELTLNIVVGETVEVDDAHWATLVEPVAPITLDLDKAVGEWPAGEAAIPADDVGAFLTARTDSETELGRLDRQELFWETWLPLVKAGGRNAVPGEVDVGLGRFVRGLAAGEASVTGLPVSAAFSVEEMYGPTEEMLPDLVAQAIPYPQEPSRGSRVQTQLLNGTTRSDLTTRAATSLVAGGAEIALVGNAATFAEPTTRFVYTDSKLRDDAEKLRDAFGVGEVVQSPADDDAPPVDEDRIDVTVILGADALDALGG